MCVLANGVSEQSLGSLKRVSAFVYLPYLLLSCKLSGQHARSEYEYGLVPASGPTKSTIQRAAVDGAQPSDQCPDHSVTREVDYIQELALRPADHA